VKERAIDYNGLRRLWIDSLVYQLHRQRTIPFRTPVEHLTILCEPDRRRDPDGVYGGAMKLLLDAMVTAGLLPTDGAANVGRCRGWDVLYVHPQAAGVYLKIYEPGDAHEWTGLQVQGRLPDLNELLAAREVGARRMVRA
jgi:hypothetical protein